MLGQTNLYVNRSGTRPDKLLHCLYGKTCVIYRDAYIQVVRNTYAYTRIFFRQINRHDDFYTRVIRESCLLINELPLFSLKTNTFFFFFALLSSSFVGKFVHICFDDLTKDHFYWLVTYCPWYIYILGWKQRKWNCIPRIEELKERNGLPRIN